MECGNVVGLNFERAGTDLKSQVRAQRHLDRPLHLKHRKCTCSKEGALPPGALEFNFKRTGGRVDSACTARVQTSMALPIRASALTALPCL